MPPVGVRIGAGPVPILRVPHPRRRQPTRKVTLRQRLRGTSKIRGEQFGPGPQVWHGKRNLIEEIWMRAKTTAVEDFRSLIRREVEALCADEGWVYNSEVDRGYAFQRWCSSLLAHHERVSVR